MILNWLRWSKMRCNGFKLVAFIRVVFEGYQFFHSALRTPIIQSYRTWVEFVLVLTWWHVNNNKITSFITCHYFKTCTFLQKSEDNNSWQWGFVVYANNSSFTGRWVIRTRCSETLTKVFFSEFLEIFKSTYFFIRPATLQALAQVCNLI